MDIAIQHSTNRIVAHVPKVNTIYLTQVYPGIQR